MTDHAPVKLHLLNKKEMAYTKQIPFHKPATSLLVSNAQIQLKIVKYDGSGGSDVGM